MAQQKIWVLLGINIVMSIGVSFIVGNAFAALDNAYLGLIVSLAIKIPISVSVVGHFARNYNDGITAGTAKLQ